MDSFVIVATVLYLVVRAVVYFVTDALPLVSASSPPRRSGSTRSTSARR